LNIKSDFCFADGPVIDCATQTAHIDEKNVYLRCEVRARPGLTSLFWVVDVNGTMVSGGEVTNEYWAAVTVSGRTV
jgi:hypothetical protein